MVFVNIAALMFALIQPNFLMAAVYLGSAILILYIMAFISLKTSNIESMGMEDIIVAGTMGALLGSPFVFVAFFLAAIIAILPMLFSRDKPMPFVPFLALATFIIYIYKPEVDGLILGFFY